MTPHPRAPSGAHAELHELRGYRAQLARIFEPTDLAGAVLLETLGPAGLLGAIAASETPAPALRAAYRRAATDLLPDTAPPHLDKRFAAWRSRLPVPDPETELRHAAAVDAWIAIPEDPDWPSALDDLGLQRPVALWGRGDRDLLPGLDSSVAVVGSRNASAYGASITRQIAGEVAAQGWCVISGGAYGIDAQAHRAALAVGTAQPPTAAVCACGLDRFYPSGNAALLREIAGRGLLLGEVPLGCSPTRYRFLQRNRLIAALSGLVVVTEAAWRSGALNTAHHAEALSRDVAAVPGDVLGGRSAGCHRLIRDAHAVLVGNGVEVLELLGPLGNEATCGLQTTQDEAARRPEDGLDTHLLRLLDALPVRTDADPARLSRVAGLPAAEVLTGLSALRERGLAVDCLLGWRRVGSRHEPTAPQERG